MIHRLVICAAFAASLAMCLPATSAASRSIAVSGTVSGARGYTVTASGVSGTGKSVKLGAAGRFSLKVSAASVSLNLIRPDGTYYGPVVLDKVKRGRVHVAIARSVKLGRIKLAGTHAVVRKPVAKRSLARTSVRADRRGKPLGAGRLGLPTAGTLVRAVAAQQPPPPQGAAELGADGDQDGLTNAYDVDDDNDAVLDGSDADQGPSQNGLARVFTNLWPKLQDTLNVNLGNVTGEEIDRVLAKYLNAVFVTNVGMGLPGRQVTAVNVDCFTIAWCAPGTGTALVGQYGPNGAPAGSPQTGTRWVEWDADGDGLPNLYSDGRGHEPDFSAGLDPATGRAGMDPAATLNFKFTTDQGPVEYATTLGPSFITTPAIVSLGGTAISYPIGPDDPGFVGGPGEISHDVVLSSPRVTFTLYRPQRAAIAGAETGEYYDMGGLRYEVSDPFSNTGAPCKAEAFSDLSPTLTLADDNEFDQGVKDTAPDAPSGSGATISFTVDLAQCASQPLTSTRGFPLGVIARTARGENTGTSLFVKMAG